MPQNLLDNHFFIYFIEFAMLLQKNSFDIKNSTIYRVLSLFDFKIINMQKFILRLGEKYHGFISYKEIMSQWSIKEFLEFIYVNYLNNEEDRIEAEKNK